MELVTGIYVFTKGRHKTGSRIHVAFFSCIFHPFVPSTHGRLEPPSWYVTCLPYLAPKESNLPLGEIAERALSNSAFSFLSRLKTTEQIDFENSSAREKEIESFYRFGWAHMG